MKHSIHPTYYPNAKVTCACGAVRVVGSTQQEIHVEVCSNCHPFYTGKQKLVDTARRVEKFEARKAKILAPKEKKVRARKVRSEPLKPTGRLYSTKSKMKSTTKSDDKKSFKKKEQKPQTSK